MAKYLQALPSGAFTLSGKTSGPAVPLGRNRYRKSQLMFIHESELRKAVKEMGWVLPETHEQVRAKLAETGEKLAETQKRAGELERENETLREAVAIVKRPAAKQTATSTRKAAPKAESKRGGSRGRAGKS